MHTDAIVNPPRAFPPAAPAGQSDRRPLGVGHTILTLAARGTPAHLATTVGGEAC